MATMAAVLNSEPEPVSKVLPEMPREVERCVNRCLRKELDRRSQSMAEIRVALQELKEESESGSLAPAVVTQPGHAISLTGALTGTFILPLANPDAGKRPERYKVANNMSVAWAAFARSSDPNHAGIPKWPAYTLDQRATMILDSECKVVNDPYKEERLVWLS